VGPEEKSKLFQRDTGDLPGSPSLRVTALSVSLGWKVRLNEAFSRCDRALRSSSEFSSWPVLNSTVNGVRQRVAPYRIYLVSLEPDVAILVPHDFGTTAGKSLNEIFGPRPQHSSVSDYLENHINIGTSVPFLHNAKWVSPDSNHNPSELTLDNNGDSSIAIGDVVLTLKRSGSQWNVNRK